MSTTSSDDSSASGDSDHDNAAPITSDQNSSDEGNMILVIFRQKSIFEAKNSPFTG